ncbi:hypothetical protein CFI00_10170 [Nocardioides sp. S5]|nr:hypothetical protein CFI00_10170 [Nocardioides sp. S5]
MHLPRSGTVTAQLEREPLTAGAERSRLALSVALVAYVAAVVLANIVTERLGLVSVGFGLLVTAGTYAAGFALLARDFVHRFGSRGWAIAAIALGGAISWALSSPALAVASTVAFVSAELVDLVVYEPIRRAKGFIQGALVSNIVSAPIDTFVFLSLAGFPLTLETVGGQFIGKVLWATAIPLSLYWLGRRWLTSRRSRDQTTG